MVFLNVRVRRSSVNRPTVEGVDIDLMPAINQAGNQV